MFKDGLKVERSINIEPSPIRKFNQEDLKGYDDRMRMVHECFREEEDVDSVEDARMSKYEVELETHPRLVISPPLSILSPEMQERKHCL